jgi:hypothetical protein
MDAASMRVGIVPTDEYERRRRLWSALEGAYPVRFEGRERGAVDGLDAIVAIGAGDTANDGGSGSGSGSGDEPADIPRLLAEGAELANATATPGALVFSQDAALARPLRGARLGEAYCGATAMPAARERDVVLATLDGAPVWTRARADARAAQRVACAPTELEEGEALRERLEPGRCLALLALTQFLDDLVCGANADARRATRPLRATFLIDDPNLHWPSYGHLRYPELLRSARTHGYHLAIAMVPLDGWFSDPRVTRMFREGARHLSVCVHGNEHDGPELQRPRSVAEGVALGARALSRAAAFERRTGVAMDRVMVPPHERISEPMARALVSCGFEGLCTTRPYPWAVTSPSRPWLTRPAEAGPLAAWGPVDIVAGGLPILLRADFALHPREDLVLRAFLGQPLVLYGHHDLLRDGPEALAARAAEIERLGEVRWGSLAEITRASVARVAHASSAAAIEATAPEASTRELAPRRLRPVLRRVAAEGKIRAQAFFESRGA